MRLAGIKILACGVVLMLTQFSGWSQEHVEWVDLYGCEVENDTILRHHGQDNWNYQARTSNVLEVDSNGYVEFVVTNYDQYQALGFIKESANFPCALDDVAYGFYQNPWGTYKVTESGTRTELTSSTPSNGDTLRLERIEDTVFYYENGVLRKQVTVSISERWVIGALFFDDVSSLATFENVKTDITTKRLNLKVTLVHDNLGDSLGSIDITPEGGSGSYSYSWSNGAVTEDVDSLGVGTYVVTVVDTNSDTVIGTYKIWNKQLVNWTDLYGIELSNNGTRAKAQAGNQWSGWIPKGMTSTYLDTLEDGEFEFVISDGLTRNMIGFVEEGIELEDLTNSDLLFGFYTNHVDKSYAKESGASYSAWHKYDAGETVRISRVDTIVTYYVNDVPVREVSCQRNARWRIACFFYIVWFNEYYDSVKSTFHNEILHHTVDVTSIDGLNSTGSIDLTVGGGTVPYTYEWSNDSTIQDLTGLSKGTYSVIIRDVDTSFIIYDTINVYKRDTVHWNHTKGLIVEDINGSKLRAPYVNGTWSYSTAITSNYLDPGEDGEFYYEVIDPVCFKVIGFVTASVGAQPGINDFEHAIYVDNTRRVRDKQGVSGYRVHHRVEAGYILKVSRIGDQLSYYVNGGLMRTVTVNPTERWYLGATFKGTYADEFYKNVYCSFEKKVVNADYVVTDITEVKGKGSIDLSVYGGVPPFQYLWSTGDTVQDLDSLDVGIYYVTISDSINDTIIYAIPIYEKELASYDSIINVIVSGDDDEIVTSGSTASSWTDAQGKSVQYLDVGEDGEFLFTDQYAGQDRMFGFVEDTTTLPVAYTQWTAAIRLSSSDVYYSQLPGGS
ncbi:MAG: SprB repeat-containing protein, partial [Flavobacteriales bacterium]|nr:SprB repeat-containing protein [Flavobacteriales bacterium]